MPDTTNERSKVRRLRGRLARGAAVAGVTAVLLAGVTSGGGGPAGATEASVSGQAAVAQAAQCVSATNSDHVAAGRASSWLFFVWARGSNTYIGLLWATTSLQEGPAGTWSPVNQCTPTGPDGRAIYAANCAVCHGPEGVGGAGPPLLGIGAHGRDELIAVVTNGRGAMPAWNGRLTPAEIGAVVDYIRTFPGEHSHDHGEH